jgi:hypothetical protein
MPLAIGRSAQSPRESCGIGGAARGGKVAETAGTEKRSAAVSMPEGQRVTGERRAGFGNSSVTM